MTGEPKYFVIKEIGAGDAAQYAVVSRAQTWVGQFKRNTLVVEYWYETEDEARAHAHRLLFPED